MPAVTRVDPKTIFTPDEWARVSRQSAWKGPALVAFAWAVIIGAGALFIYAPNPATYLLGIEMLGDMLEEGLEALGLSLDDLEA